MKNIWVYFTFLVSFQYASTEECKSKQTCSECIQTPKCAWSTSEYFFGESRCFIFGANINNDDSVITPTNVVKLIKSTVLGKNETKNEVVKTVQFAPQHISLKLRINEPFEFNFMFLQINDNDTIVIKDNAALPLQLKYYTSCSFQINSNENLPQQNECLGKNSGSAVNFKAQIEATKCPENESSWKQTIQIFSPGNEDILILDVEIICNCDCDKSHEINSVKCNLQGTYKCGQCNCNEKSFGKYCECARINDLNSDDLNLPMDANCKANNESSIICSGRGICACGTCQCDFRPNPEELVYGKYCECDNFSCSRYNGLLCAGHGTCECGECLCESGWAGEDCACNTSNQTCTAPNGIICSGNGDCDCGVCRCLHLHSGKFCEITRS